MMNPPHRSFLRRPRAGAAVALAVAVVGCGLPPVRVPETSERYDYELGRVALEVKHYLDAQTHLKRFLDLHPGHALADSAQLLLGLAQYRSKSYAEAAIEFAILVREFPRSELRDDAAYHECLCYSGQMRPAQLDPTFALRARTCLNEFMLRYPESALQDEARQQLGEIADRLAEKEYRLGVMFSKLKRYKASIIYLKEVLQNYPTSRWVPWALLWLGRSSEGQDDVDQAVQSYDALLDSFPDHPAAEEARKRLEKLAGAAGRAPSAGDSAARESP